MKPETKSIKTLIKNMWITTSDPSVSAFPLLVVFEYLVKLFLAEIRPVGGRDIYFSIGDLPQQEIADAHLPAGPDQQVRIRYALGIKMLRHDISVNRFRIQLPA